MIKKIVPLVVPARGVIAAMLAVGIVMLLAPVPIARGANITVNVINDEFNTDADCSLREALYAANYNVAVSGCPAGSATTGDSIMLTNGATYTLTLAGSDDTGLAGDLDIINNPSSFDLLIFVSEGGTVNIHQNAIPDDRIFDILGANTSVTIVGTAVKYGQTSEAGGGIRNQGKLTLANVRVTETIAFSGGGIYNDGRLTISSGSLIGDNVAANLGGGIYNANYLSMSGGSWVSRSSAKIGGGIFNSGGAFLHNVTIHANTAERGGGIFHTTPYQPLTIRGNSEIIINFATIDGGGLEVAAGTVTILDSRFFGNEAPSGGAIFNQQNGGPISVSGSCIDSNLPVAVVNTASTTLTATSNWWGSATGPGSVGPGLGDRVSTGVLFDSWLTVEPAFCSP